MKIKLLLVLFVFCFIPLSGMANPKDEDYKKSKTIKKEFDVNANALLKINNKYGNVDVVSWNQNRVEIEVTITASGNNESKVAQKLNEIGVDFENSASLVSAKTIIEKVSGWSITRSSNVNFQIDYKVKMPVTNNVDFANDYGSISLNELRGKADINCDYGKIIIGSLFHENNSINIDYTNDSNIEFMNGGSINADYSSFRVEKAKKVLLNADYTNSVFENIEELNFDCDYGKIEVGNVNRVVGNGDYLTMDFGTVYKKMEINADYGGFRLDKLGKDFERLKVDTDYTGVKIGIASGAAFDFIIQTSYGGFDFDMDNVTYTKKIVKSTSKYYEGNLNSTSATAKIEITANYGNVKLYTN